jgi:hypothetical protein
MKLQLLSALGLLIFSVTPCGARNLSAVDGNVLLAKCHAAEKMTDVSPKLSNEEWAAGFYCLGFVQGVMDADGIWQAGVSKGLGSKTTGIVPYCVPNDVSWPQIIRVLVKWLEENPDKLNSPGYDVIYWAMSKNFPCAKSAP